MSRKLQLDRDGAEHVPAAFSTAGLSRLAALFANLADDRPGARLKPIMGLSDAVRPANRIATSLLGLAAKPVRATLFDKSPARNWALGWHQDRTIAVRARIDVPGFGDWTLKHGIHHAVPPFDLLERMLTLRIHLDPVGADNAPLLILPGTHRLGRLSENEVARLASTDAQAACTAAAGDVWAYATPILHASARATRPARRRVLQLLYSADDLPGGLQWLGI